MSSGEGEERDLRGVLLKYDFAKSFELGLDMF